jgi:hypothetical protein
MLANAGAYTSDTLDGTGHLRVTVSPSCVTVDFVRAYLPADTVSGLHHNREVAFSYSVGNCTTAINTLNLEHDVEVYPNPANTSLTVKVPDGINNYKIRLINTLGETLLQSSRNHMDIRNIPNGIYLINIQTEKSNFNHKIVINH